MTTGLEIPGGMTTGIGTPGVMAAGGGRVNDEMASGVLLFVQLVL